MAGWRLGRRCVGGWEKPPGQNWGNLARLTHRRNPLVYRVRTLEVSKPSQAIKNIGIIVSPKKVVGCRGGNRYVERDSLTFG